MEWKQTGYLCLWIFTCNLGQYSCIHLIVGFLGGLQIWAQFWLDYIIIYPLLRLLSIMFLFLSVSQSAHRLDCYYVDIIIALLHWTLHPSYRYLHFIYLSVHWLLFLVLYLWMVSSGSPLFTNKQTEGSYVVEPVMMHCESNFYTIYIFYICFHFTCHMRVWVFISI